MQSNTTVLHSMCEKRLFGEAPIRDKCWIRVYSVSLWYIKLYVPLSKYEHERTHACVDECWFTRDQEPRWQPGPQIAAAARCFQSPPCADLSFPCGQGGGSWESRWCDQTLTCGNLLHLYFPVTQETNRGGGKISIRKERHKPLKAGKGHLYESISLVIGCKIKLPDQIQSVTEV